MFFGSGCLGDSATTGSTNSSGSLPIDTTVIAADADHFSIGTIYWDGWILLEQKLWTWFGTAAPEFG